MLKKKIIASFAGLFGLFFAVALFFSSGTFVGSASAAIASEDMVYLGGTPVGVLQDASGAVITQIVQVETENGVYSPIGTVGGRVGDIIIKIDGKEVRSSQDIKNALKNSADTLVLTINRSKQVFEVAVKPAFDIVLKERKLGILMKDSLAGVGTLTFIRQNLTYGALGHMIYDGISSDKSIYKSGNLFPCRIIGYKKGLVGEAGELKGTFNRSDKPIGTIEKNLFCGIFGKFNSGNSVVDRELTAVGHKNEVVAGNAKILTTLEGKTPQYYDIEIIKANNQVDAREKSMVIRVTDKILLKETGGIVQGMSGSPILQHGKIIGAVTHVFVNDPTSGYGIYLDWMLQN